MKQAVKFTFDTYFGDQASRPLSKEDVAPLLTETDIARARDEAFAAGFAAGKQDALSSADQEVTHALNCLAESATSLLTALSAHMANTRKEAASIALEASRKLAPALVATRPIEEIESVLRDCLSHLNREPHILLRVSPSLVDRLKEIVDRMSMERGLTGRIILLGEPSIIEGDCVVEWADGGVTRNSEETSRELEEIVSRYIKTITSSTANADALSLPETSFENK